MQGTRTRYVEAIHAKTQDIRRSRVKPLGPGALFQLPKLPGEISLCYPGSAEQKGSVPTSPPVAPACGPGEAPHAGQTSAPGELQGSWALGSLLQPEAPARHPAGRAALSLGASAPGQHPLLRDGRKGNSSASWTRVLQGRGRCWVCLCRSCLWWFLGARTPNVGTAPFPMLPLRARASSPLSA